MPGKCHRLGVVTVVTERPEHTMGHTVPREMSPAREGTHVPRTPHSWQSWMFGESWEKTGFSPKTPHLPFSAGALKAHPKTVQRGHPHPWVPPSLSQHSQVPRGSISLGRGLFLQLWHRGQVGQVG